MVGQVQFRLGQFGAVTFGLQIQVKRGLLIGVSPGPLAHDVEREGCFADLPSAQKRNGRYFLKSLNQSGKRVTVYRLRHYSGNYGF